MNYQPSTQLWIPSKPSDKSQGKNSICLTPQQVQSSSLLTINQKNNQISVTTSCPLQNYNQCSMERIKTIKKYDLNSESQKNSIIINQNQSNPQDCDSFILKLQQQKNCLNQQQFSQGFKRSKIKYKQAEKKREKEVFRTFGAGSDEDEDQIVIGQKFAQQNKRLNNNLVEEPQDNKESIKMQKNFKNKKNHELVFLNINQKKQDNDLISPTKINQKIQQTECYFEVFSKKWQKTSLKLTRLKLTIGPININLDKILKAKIFPAEMCNETSSPFRVQANINFRDSTSIKSFKDSQKVMKQNIIKVMTVDNNIFHFGQRYPIIILSQPKQLYSESTIPKPQSPCHGLSTRLPLPFLTFGKLILKKLKQLYPQIKSTQWHQPQFPLRSVIKKSSSFALSLPAPFLKYNTKNFAYIHGKIYKKSQHKSKWEKRYIIINQNGIYSYKNQNDQVYSYSIEAKSIKYMWTWFTILKVDKLKDLSTKQDDQALVYEDPQLNNSDQQISRKIANQLKNSTSNPYFHSNNIKKQRKISEDQQQKHYNKNLMASFVSSMSNKQISQNQNPYLIIKLKHGFNGQTQFGIPVCGFDNEINMSRNWLFAFYKVLSKYEY